MECSPTARLLLIGMLNFCDDGGNHPASAKRLKAQIFPSDDISTSAIDGLVLELTSCGLVSAYSHEERDYWHVTGWHHQKIEKPTYKHPPYVNQQSVGDVSKNGRRMVGENSSPEGMGKGRGMDGEWSNPPIQGKDSNPPRRLGESIDEITGEVFQMEGAGRG